MSRKTVLVTGASRGIGKAIAIKFARKGYNVAISCIRNEGRLMQTKKKKLRIIRYLVLPIWEIWGIWIAAKNCSQR